MLTGERRTISARRGMTVLGKIPAVPKPINLPSQRLENRGLDPNVEIVPRGSVSWGATGRSPPTNSAPWGGSTQASSPPVGNGPWGSGPRPGHQPGAGPWGVNPSRPSSAGSGTRPSSAGSIGQTQEVSGIGNAWGSTNGRPSSASGVLGQAQSPSTVARPRSAETRTSAGPPALTRFADQPNGSPSPIAPAWGGAGTPRKPSEDSQSLHQPARFTLTRVDFPTLGSEKNPDLRPQQNKTGSSPAERPGSSGGKMYPEERPGSGAGGPYEEHSHSGVIGYGGQERVPDAWRKEHLPYGGPPGMGDGGWYRDGPPPPLQQPQPESWRREPGHGPGPGGGGPSDDNWRRMGPPVGPYGPPGPGRFQHDGFMPQQRYNPGPGPYGRGGGPGPGGFGRHGDMYGPFGRPGGAPPPRPGPPMGPGMYPGPGPYDNYYGPPGPGYGNMDEREMMMINMGGAPPGMYGNYQQGPPEPYGRFSHGGPGPGPRQMMQNSSGGMRERERSEGIGYEGELYRDNTKLRDGTLFKDVGNSFKENSSGKDGAFPRDRPASAGEVRRGLGSSNSGPEVPRPLSARGSQHSGHRDWGAVASSDEPMDWTKPVFEEDVAYGSPRLSKQSSTVSRAEVDSSPKGGSLQGIDQPKHSELSGEQGAAVDIGKGRSGPGENKDRLKLHSHSTGLFSKSENAQSWRHGDADSDGSIAVVKEIENKTIESKDVTGRRPVSSEESTSGEKRVVKDGSSFTRERSIGREHLISPQGHRSGASKKEFVLSGSRSGHYNSGANYKSGVVSTPRTNSAPISETRVSDEVVSSPVLEKHSSNPSSPCGSDSQKNSEKLRILKRIGEGPDSPQKDVVNTTDLVQPELGVPLSTETKEEPKPKSKPLHSHEGEKEWRPKAPAADSVESNRIASTVKQSSSSSVVSSVAPISADKGEAENELSSDSYDYDAQRARMKEIAAQRAKQLRKEEEERNKEQKAKAMAKLEELNRRASSSQPSSQSVVEEAVSDVVTVTASKDDVKVVSSDDVKQEKMGNESGAFGGSAPRGSFRSGRNEHGKRERLHDRKGNGRSREDHKGFDEHREHPKPRVNYTPNQQKVESSTSSLPVQQLATSKDTLHPPVAPGPNVKQTESQATGFSDVRDASGLPHQLPVKSQDVRSKGKQFVSQAKQSAKLPPAPKDGESVDAQDSILVSDSTPKTSNWSGVTLDLDPNEVTLSLGMGHPANDTGTAAFRRKKSKNSARNRQKPEVIMPVIDASSVVGSQGWSTSTSPTQEPNSESAKVGVNVTGLDEVVEAPKSGASGLEVKEAASQDVKSEQGRVESSKDGGTESGGNDGGYLKFGGEGSSRKSQRKSQTVRRVVRGDRGVSQDVRVADKPHSSEGMVWAPVKSPSVAHSNAVKVGSGESPADGTGDKKEDHPIVPQSRARRAELERYTPKPVVKQQAQQQEEMQTQSASAVSQQHLPDVGSATGTEDVPHSSGHSTEIKFGSEARQFENSTRPARAHTSWRQRGPVTERVSGPKGTGQSHHTESSDTSARQHQPNAHQQNQQGHHRSRGVQNIPLEQTKPPNLPNSRPIAPQANRQHALANPSEQEIPNTPVTQQVRSNHNNNSQSHTVTFGREPKSPQDAAAPYQPPRPSSKPSGFGNDSEGQASQEQGKSQRLNVVQIDRNVVHYGKPDHTAQERGNTHHQPRHNSRQHGGFSSSDKDHVQGRSGGHIPKPAPTNEVEISKEKERTSQQVKVTSVSHGVSGSSERERSPGKGAAPRSPGRQRGRPHPSVQERDSIGPTGHGHHQQRFRQPGHERDLQREVSNAVHHQQPRPPSDGQRQQSTSVSDPLANDSGSTHQHSSKAAHKSRSSGDDQLSVPPGTNQYSRNDGSVKPHGSGESQKSSHYQAVSQSAGQNQKSQQQGYSQTPKSDNVHNPYWNGERSGGSTFHGHRGRGRFGGRGSGGRSSDTDSRRESFKQRATSDASGTTVTNSVGG